MIDEVQPRGSYSRVEGYAVRIYWSVDNSLSGSMAGEDINLKGWRAYINTHTIPGRRNVSVTSYLSYIVVGFSLTYM